MDNLSEEAGFLSQLFVGFKRQILVDIRRVIFMATVIVLVKTGINVPVKCIRLRTVIAVHEIAIEHITQDVQLKIAGFLSDMTSVTSRQPYSSVLVSTGTRSDSDKGESVIWSAFERYTLSRVKVNISNFLQLTNNRGRNACAEHGTRVAIVKLIADLDVGDPLIASRCPYEGVRGKTFAHHDAPHRNQRCGGKPPL